MILIWHASQQDLNTPRLVKGHHILCSPHTIPLQCLLSLPAALPGTSLTWEVCRRVGVFDLIDIGFKFVHFQLKQGRDREEDVQLHVPAGQTLSSWKPCGTSSISAFGTYGTKHMECWPRLEPGEGMLQSKQRGWEMGMCAGQEPGAVQICQGWSKIWSNSCVSF